MGPRAGRALQVMPFVAVRLVTAAYAVKLVSGWFSLSAYISELEMP